MFDEYKRLAEGLERSLSEGQEELRRRTFRGLAADGAVLVRVTGDGRLKKIELDNERLTDEQWARLPRLIVQAGNEALAAARDFAIRRLATQAADLSGGHENEAEDEPAADEDDS